MRIKKLQGNLKISENLTINGNIPFIKAATSSDINLETALDGTIFYIEDLHKFVRKQGDQLVDYVLPYVNKAGDIMTGPLSFQQGQHTYSVGTAGDDSLVVKRNNSSKLTIENDTSTFDNDLRVSSMGNDATSVTTKGYVDEVDIHLQQQIDTIISKSDVVDVVATYADLMDYDVSTLNVNDVIKVLVDETHNSATSYYKLLRNVSEELYWSFIGSLGPYSTATNVVNGPNGTAEVASVGTSSNSIMNKAYLDTAISDFEGRTEDWEEELETMLNLRLDDIDENLAKLYYCNVFLKDVSIASCSGTKYNGGDFTREGDKADKGNVINSITFNFIYNKLPLGCKIYLKNLTDDVEYNPINAVSNSEPVLSYTVTNLDLSNTTLWEVVLRSEYDGSVSKKVIPVYVCNKVYWGLATLVNNQITNPTWESELSPVFVTNKPVTSDNDKYIVYAFPVEDVHGIDYGIPMFTLSPSQFVGGVAQFVQGQTTSFSFTNSDNNYTENYYIYITDNNNLGDVTIKVEKQ